MTAVVPVADGLFPDVPEQDYHADRGSLSVSGAKLLLPPSCPAKFRWAQDNERPRKKVYDFGHLTHRIVLGAGAEIAVLDPAVHGLKADGTVAESPAATSMWKKAAAEARAVGQVPVHVDEFTQAQAMAEVVLTDEDAGPLFAAGNAEQALYVTDPVTGVRLRGRCDWITPGGDIVDYKTSLTANPAALVRKFWQLGYFMQAAWYRDLLVALGVAENPRFYFVVQEKEPPHVVQVVDYDDEAIDEGRRLNRLAIETFARCRDADDWPSYSTGVTTLSLPRWALRDGIQAAADDLINELEGIYLSHD